MAWRVLLVDRSLTFFKVSHCFLYIECSLLDVEYIYLITINYNTIDLVHSIYLLPTAFAGTFHIIKHVRP